MSPRDVVFLRKLTVPFLVLALGLGCAGGSGPGNLRPFDSTGDSAERARIRAAMGAVNTRVGHSVDFDIDPTLGGDPAILAEIIESFAGKLESLNPGSSFGCHPLESCDPLYALDVVAKAGAAFSSLRAVHMVSDPVLRGADGRAGPRFDPRSGVLTWPVAPDALAADIQPPEAFDAVVLASWTAHFAGRTGAQLAPDELPAFVDFLERGGRPTDETYELATLYGQLTGPAQRMARSLLVRADLGARENALPEALTAWAGWYRGFASTLDADSLRTAGWSVFPPIESGTAGKPPSPELPGLPAFDHAWSLLQAQAHGPETAESAVLACKQPTACDSPLFQFFARPKGAPRLQRLVQALLGAHDPVLTQFVLERLFQQRDLIRSRQELLAAFAGDPPTWQVALESALLVNAGPDGGALAEIWRAKPVLRAPMLAAAVYAEANAPSVLSETDANEAKRNLDNSVSTLTMTLCHTADRADFVARVRAGVAPRSLASIEDSKTPCAAADR